MTVSGGNSDGIIGSGNGGTSIAEGPSADADGGVGPACGSPCAWTDGTEDDLKAKSLNCPSTWDANALQDAALFTILNLSALPAARPYLPRA